MKTAEEFWAKVDRHGADECWPWLGGTNGGKASDRRGRVVYGGRAQYAYRVSWELTNGQPIEEGLVARRSCDNPICVNPGHIEPGTQLDNMTDAKERGRARTTPRYGMDHHITTVPPDLVRRAVEDYLAGDERQADVAARYGVSQVALSRWVRGAYRPDSGVEPVSTTWAKLKPCGTHAAYARHVRNGEAPCDNCLAGERDYNSARRARKNAARLAKAAA